ncbi:MAG: hypothetical protein IPJ86_10665 [Bacteroidetes bacterium]|nr:hypothetical protein [Bacteroidota bacterium]
MTVGKLKLIGNSLAFFEFDYKDNIYKTTSFEYSEKQIEFACIKFASEYPIKNEVYLFGTDKKTFEWRANNLGYNPYYNKIYYSKEFCYQD